MLSVIIPSRNRSRQLERALLSLVNLNISNEMFEIIVVDNGSTDATPDIVARYINRFDHISIRYFYDATPGLLTGRHRGAAEASGDILCFIDDDVTVTPGWARAIAEVMQNRPDVMFLTGPNLPEYEAYPPDWLARFWSRTPYGGKMCGWLSLLDLGNTVRQIHPNYVWGLNFTVRKSALEALGGFHPDSMPKSLQHFQGDGETGLTIKAHEKNMTALYHPGVMLYHRVPASRMTAEYFDERAFYQGVADSFTAIRNTHGLNQNPQRAGDGMFKRQYEKMFILPKNALLKAAGLMRLPSEIRALQNRFDGKKKAGFLWHQKQFNENVSVQSWVLKANYLDYKLPSND